MQLTDDVIEEFSTALISLGHPPNTIRAYVSDLRDLREYLDGADLAEDTVAAWLTAGRRVWASNTTNRRLAAVRRLWRHVTGAKGFLSDYNLPPAPPGKPHPLKGGMDDVERLCAAAENDQRRALFALCGYCGLRVSEAVAIRPSDIDLDEMEVCVFGKGDKTRTVPISTHAWAAMLAAYRMALDVDDRQTLCGFGERQARNIVTRTALLAGMDHAASHDLRHTFGSYVVDETGDVEVARELLGHASITTTQGYSGATKAKKRRAVEALR